MLKETLNKGMSTPIAVSIILTLAFIVAGYTIWQASEIRTMEKSELIMECNHDSDCEGKKYKLSCRIDKITRKCINNMCRIECEMTEEDFIGKKESEPADWKISRNDKGEIEFSEWEKYENEELGIEFQYPKEFSEISLKSQKNDGYTFESSNKFVTEIYYHEPSGVLSFINKEKECEGEIEGSGGFYEYETDAYLLNFIYSNKEIKLIYYQKSEFINEDTGEKICPQPMFSREIKSISLSPNEKYVYLTWSSYEINGPLFLKIDTGIDILKYSNIWYAFNYDNIYWSQNNESLAIESFLNEFAGMGTPGLFVSDYGNPEKLNEIYSFSEEEHMCGSRLQNINFSEDNLLFFSINLKENKENEWKCSEEIIKNFRYNLKTKDLEEIE